MSSEPSKEEFRAWLDEFRAYDFTSSPTPFRLTSLKTSDRTWDAVKLMLQRHVSSVAVFDEKQANFRGFVDILDVATIVFMLNFSKELSGALGKEPSWNKFAETELKVLDKSTVEEMINVSGRDPWVDVKFQATASELLGSLAGGKGARRVAVRDAGNAGIEGIVSQWDAVRFLQRQITHAHWFSSTLFANIIAPTLSSARLGRPLVCVRASEQTMKAFSTLAEQSVSAAAVLDEHGALVGVLSASDFLRSRRDETGHAWDHFFDDLREPVSAYLSRRNAYFPGQFSKAPITIDMGRDTVMDVLHKYTSNHVHRLFIVDDAFRPIGVFSVGDIVEVFLRYSGVQKSVEDQMKAAKKAHKKVTKKNKKKKEKKAKEAKKEKKEKKKDKSKSKDKSKKDKQ